MVHVVVFYYKKRYVLLVSLFASVLLDWSVGDLVVVFVFHKIIQRNLYKHLKACLSWHSTVDIYLQ
jgi:hypothetical protein